MDPNGDPDVLRVWSLLSEVSEQLSQNRSSAVNLHALADGAKVGERVYGQDHMRAKSTYRRKLSIRRLALCYAGVYCNYVRRPQS